MRIVAADGYLPADDEADILLLPGRAAWLPARRTLLVADLHLGKAATFRHAGLPVPEGSAQQDLARLEHLVTRHKAERVLVLGDLFHARSGCTEQVFAEWASLRSRLASTAFVLVVGNHDRGVGPLPASLGLEACVPALDEPPFHFVHEPASALGGPGAFVVAGHLHPRLAITSPGGGRLVERCFVADPALLVMPAFGSFTGGHAIHAAADRRLWVARDDAVLEVTRLALLAARSHAPRNTNSP